MAYATAKDYTALIKVFNIAGYTSSKGGRKGPCVRVKLCEPADIEKTINKVFGKNTVTIDISPRQRSDKYPTYSLTFKQDFATIKRYTEFDLVNNFKAQGFGIKALTPDALKLAGKTIKISNLNKAVEEAVNKQLTDDALKKFLMNVYYTSISKERLDTGLATAFSSQLHNIANDFGEVSGAAWYSTKIKADSVEFPNISNLPLVDYFVYEKLKNSTIRHNVSAKAGEGSTPSLKSIVDELKIYSKNATGDKKKIANAIIDLATLQVTAGLLKMAQFLNTYYSCPGYAELTKIFHTNEISTQMIANKMRTMQNGTEAKVLLEDFYNAAEAHTGKTHTGEDSVDKAIRLKSSKIYGIVTAPLTYHVVNLLNKYDDFHDVLNEIVKSLDVTQVYMDLSKNKLNYIVKTFKDSKITWFAPRIGVPNPDGNRMGFRIVRH